ncbi:SusD/RagB family nutrient-binding outer membrane lipoprotein [Zeaxanthinibacter sp. PT1]|uniref:SusD/RagB family nutrient-binding outer membrane lipoprotein n=1 Tax=Zeaxanthinibacter TaxID=561554 RepID=UPI00234A702C|nr:SusD/RagB family nutrient-binding outer membrane lipoprotein [Zeaxanthinibacter sp. PT1]MDC6352643.1 SusD/RagB family nutrient-binding outer membrane lipoprotein [Zeaxanthinibacter sp. PT1]
MKKYILTTIGALAFMASCTVDESLNVDTKNPSAVPGSALFTNGTRNMFDLLNSSSVNNNVFRLYAQYWAQTTYPDESQYNQTGRNIGGSIWNTLYRDVLQDLKGARENLIADNQVIPDPNLENKLAIINFMEVYAYHILVDTFGDVPYAEALDPANTTPAYDSGPAIYDQLLANLDEAIANMDGGSGFEGSQDPIYDGNVALWKKAANSLKLRLAMRLADVEPAVSQQLAESAAAGELILDNSENFGIKYLASAPNTNPLWVSLVQSGRNDFVGADTFIDRLNTLDDPRRQYYFETIEGEYVGGEYGSANSPASASSIGDLLKQPDLVGNIMTAAEVNFLLAEAAARGYAVGGTAEEFYNAGVTASILEWGGTQAEADAYLLQPEVAYATASGDFEEKIGTQKWIAMFNIGYEGWTTWRLLDEPALNAPEGQTVADIPTRFLYPLSEATLNGEELNKAQSAIGGDEKTTKIFWDVD